MHLILTLVKLIILTIRLFIWLQISHSTVPSVTSQAGVQPPTWMAPSEPTTGGPPIPWGPPGGGFWLPRHWTPPS
jgi:hypothetical protein